MTIKDPLRSVGNVLDFVKGIRWVCLSGPLFNRPALRRVGRISVGEADLCLPRRLFRRVVAYCKRFTKPANGEAVGRNVARIVLEGQYLK